MRIWISTVTGLTVNFQPENEEESRKLDEALGYQRWSTTPVANDPYMKVGEGAEAVGEFGGHESQRWIIIDLNELLKHPSRR